jgi:hypothetical protein
MTSYDVINLKIFFEQTAVTNVPMFVQGSFFPKLVFPHINVFFLHLIHINTNKKIVSRYSFPKIFSNIIIEIPF